MAARKSAATVSRHVLPSGITILVETLPYVRSVALGYYLRSGSAVESQEHGGASHFLEHLVFKGTSTRSTSDIAQVIDIGHAAGVDKVGLITAKIEQGS